MPTEAKPDHNRHHLVLIVDDEVSIALMVRYALQQHGYTVLTAGSVEEARQIYAQNPVELVLLDWALPGEPGSEFLEDLRQAGDATPVVVLTGSVGRTEKARAYLSGADDFLYKPFQLETLLEAVSNALPSPDPDSTWSQRMREAVSTLRSEIERLSAENVRLRAQLKGSQ